MYRILTICLMLVFAAGCDVQLGPDVGPNLSNEEAATQSLTAIGDAYADAIREAEADVVITHRPMRIFIAQIEQITFCRILV